MALYPLFADLQGRRVLVVGGGEVAARKAARLLQAGADVVIGAPEFNEAVLELVSGGNVWLLPGAFQDAWLDGVWLVVAATDDADVNRQVAEAAGERRIFVNVVDAPALCSFQVPSVVDRGPLTLAVSSSGQAPVIARRVRERLESLFDHSLGDLVSLAAQHRRAVRRAFPDLARRRAFYDWLVDGPVARALRSGRKEQAGQLLQERLESPDDVAAGSVVLVGAGPGDPGLLTLKALRALNEADVILYDRLVSDEVLDLARRDAARVAVGKRPGEDHDATQRRIHALMLEHARAGRRVVRLKGGDAFIFGRGGEELQFLRAQGIAYQVVPGITAALACAAYAGIPLTHRDHAQSVRFVTAHCQGDGCPDWAALAQPGQTLAFYMGVGQLQGLVDALTGHGLSADTPFALVENGSRAQQRVVLGTLATLVRQARDERVQSPAMLLVGQVARLGASLAWFGAAPAVCQPQPEPLALLA